MADAKDSIVLDLDLIPGKIEGKEVLKSVFSELSKLAEAVERRSWNAETKVSVKANKKVLEHSLAETVGLFKGRLEHATGDAAEAYKAFVKHLENVLKTEAKEFGSDIPSFFQKVKNRDEEALKKLVGDPQYEKELKRYAAFVDRTNKQYSKILNRAADPLRQIFREGEEGQEEAEFQLPLAFPGLDAAIKQSDSDLKDVRQVLRNKNKILEDIKTHRAKSRYVKERTARIDENDIKSLMAKSKEFDFAGLRAALD